MDDSDINELQERLRSLGVQQEQSKDAEHIDISSEERDKVCSLYHRSAEDMAIDHHHRTCGTTGAPWLSTRRRSAPGWVNVSLLYPPSPVASDGEDTVIQQHLARTQLSPCRTPPRARGGSPHRVGAYSHDCPGWISPRRSRARHASPIRSTPGDESPLMGRSKRSMSLPLPEAALLEVGEAVGAIATASPEHATAPTCALVKPPVGKRGRCMSIEESSLEAILEDGGMTPRVSTVRRLSVPTHPVVTQMNS